MKASNQRGRHNGVLKFEKMADNRKCFVGRPATNKAPCSADLMKEKLEKWRRMRRSLACDVGTSVNRSRSAVSLDMNNNTHRFSKRNVKEPSTNKNVKEKAASGYKRIPDNKDNLACLKKRRNAFNVVARKSPHNIQNLPNPRRSNMTAGNPKTHMDKTLSMRERLEMWRAEKGKGNPERPAMKSKAMTKKWNRKPAEEKENINLYHKLENSDVYCTPASAKPVSKAKSTIKRASYLAPSHPSHHKPTTIQSSCGRQSKEKYLVRATQCKTQAPPSKVDRHGADFSNPETKSYKDKTLDMRERLELWLTEKGKTPKYKTPSVMKHSSWIKRQVRPEEIKRLLFDCCAEVDGALDESVTSAISRGEGENIEDKLQECLLQLEKGECDPEIIAAKLDLYNSSCPHASQIANYWLCRAKIAQQEKDFDRVVCLLEQAFVFKAQPESALRDAVCAFVNFMKETCQQDATVTDEMPQFPVSPPKETSIDTNNDSWLEDLSSSVIKFCLTEATPYRKKFKTTFGRPVLTPVRRSVRLEHASAQHPSVVQEHGLTVRTLGELPEEIQQDVLFKPNFAVRAELNEAWNQLRLDYNQ